MQYFRLIFGEFVREFHFDPCIKYCLNVRLELRPHSALRTLWSLCLLYEQKNISFYGQCDWPHRALRTPRTLRTELRVASHIANKIIYFSVRIANIANIAYVALCAAVALVCAADMDPFMID
jgi:hypothetical protein